MIAVDERAERPCARIVRAPEAVDEVGADAALREGHEHERD